MSLEEFLDNLFTRAAGRLDGWRPFGSQSPSRFPPSAASLFPSVSGEMPVLPVSLTSLPPISTALENRRIAREWIPSSSRSRPPLPLSYPAGLNVLRRICTVRSRRRTSSGRASQSEEEANRANSASAKMINERAKVPALACLLVLCSRSLWMNPAR